MQAISDHASSGAVAPHDSGHPGATGPDHGTSMFAGPSLQTDAPADGKLLMSVLSLLVCS